MEIITSKQNKNIQLAVKLKNKKYRHEYKMCLLEGEKLIREAILLNLEFECVFVLKNSNFNALNDIKSQKFEIANELLSYISTSVSPQGIIAIIKTDYQYKAKTSRFLVLDNIQNPDNMGAIIRTAVATNFNKIYLVNCVDIYNEKVIRASMGTLFKVEFIDTDYQQIANLSKSNKIYYADMGGESVFNIKQFEKNLGLVIGNEGNGISKEIKDITNNKLSIPMSNGVESLNASVSAGILMYHISNNC